MADEQIDYDDDEYGGAHKMQYQGSGAIPALADEELMGEDDEYDDLYNDVNVGEGFFQLHRPEPPASVGNGGFQTQKPEVPEQRTGAGLSQGLNMPGASVEGNYSNVGSHFPGNKDGPIAVTGAGVGPAGYSDGPSKGRAVEITHDAQVKNMAFQGPSSVPPQMGMDHSNAPAKIANEPVSSLNSATGGSQGVLPMPANQMGLNMNVNHPLVNENQVRPPVEGGGTMLFVGELHWWTTDSELENVLSQYGRIKEIKFFDERASGKSKGYCQVEFHDQVSASACKEGMNGYMFNGRACVVAFASPQTLKQMGASYVNKNQVQPQAQPQGRRNDGAGRGANMNYQGGDGGRNFGRGGWGQGGQGMMNRGPGGGPMRGRGGAMGGKNMVGNAAGASGGGYGQGLAGPGFGGPAAGFMHPQGLMGAGFDPTYMGRGGGYGGFPGPFPGMLPSFPAVNAMGLAGVAPHVNPAFFGRGMAPNAMGMMGSASMDGQHAGMWPDMSMGGWGGEEQGRRTRESSYGGEDGASEYGYGEVNNEKPARSTAASREKDWPSDRDRSGNSERRNRDEREQDLDKPERVRREHRHREEKEKDSYRDHRQKERDSGYEDDRDKGQSSRSRSRVIPEEESRSRSRDVDYGKRRRLPSE